MTAVGPTQRSLLPDSKPEDFTSAEERAFLRRSGSRPLLAETTAPPVRIVDLFAGCGGFSLGVREACLDLKRRFEVTLAIDAEKRALDVFRANLDPRHSFAQDILSLAPGELGSRPVAVESVLTEDLCGRPTHSPIDLLLAGPPCQGHSNLNNHTRRNDPRNRLYERVARFAELLEPTHIISENVPSVVSGRDGALDQTIRHLERLGYAIDTALVPLWQIGVPQLRKRHIVVASRARVPDVRLILENHRTPMRTVRWAIEDLDDEHLGAGAIFDTASKASEVNQRRMEWLLEHNAYDLPDKLRPKCHRDGGHSYKSMYGRLAWDEPAQTITTGFLSPGQGRYVHPSRARTLTPHEAARLQFFPDFFDFSSVRHRTILAQMIGNAVPMKLSKLVALELLS